MKINDLSKYRCLESRTLQSRHSVSSIEPASVVDVSHEEFEDIQLDSAEERRPESKLLVNNDISLPFDRSGNAFSAAYLEEKHRNSVVSKTPAIDHNSNIDKEELDHESPKTLTALINELEEELTRYHSDNTSRKYSQIRQRLKEATELEKRMALKGIQNEMVHERICQLWKNFESKSYPLSQILELEVKSKTSEKRLVERQNAVKEVCKELTIHVFQFLLVNHSRKFLSNRHLCEFAEITVRNKIVDKEIEVFLKSGRPWTMFHMNERMKNQVVTYLKQKMKEMEDIR